MSKELTWFPFDLEAFPFQNGVKMELISFPGGFGISPRVVVPIGESGEKDSGDIAFYGTVRKVGEEYWMWYLGNDGYEGRFHSKPLRHKICLAISKDGRNWEKPDLGAYEYNGNKHNNVCDLDIEEDLMSCVVFYDPEEEDKSRVFKLNFESPKYKRNMAVAFSPDGIHWTEYEHNPVTNRFFEQSGGTKIDGVYYVTGQEIGGHYSPKGKRNPRSLCTYCSRDFIHWTPANCMGFNRESLPPRPTCYGEVNGSQVHLGAGLWNRGNVILGFYGMWEGNAWNDRGFLSMNIGLVVTHDGLHYYEPVPDFPIIEARELKGDTPYDGTSPALSQGQAFANIGDKTIAWFSFWPHCYCDGVREAVWERDRLGYFQPYTHADESFIMTNEINLKGKRAKLYMNASQDSQYAYARVSLLDRNYCPIPGYAADDCEKIQENGLRMAIRWKGSDLIEGLEYVYVRVDMEGIRREDFRLYTMYLEETKDQD